MKYILLVLGLLSWQVEAGIVEVRAHAGFDFVDPAQFNDFLSSSDIKQIYLLPRVGLAAYLRPTEKLGLGAEYNSQSIKVNSSNNSSMGNAKVDVNRISAKAFYHLVEQIFITGPMVSVGLVHNTKVTGRSSAGVEFNYDDAKVQTASVGWEFGAKLTHVLIGGEMGYQRQILKELSGPTGTAGYNINLSGIYFTGFFGLTF